MSLLSRLTAPRDDGRAEVRPLWKRIVDLARDERWYARCGIADTLAGRFDALVLVLALVLRRMEREPKLLEPSVLLTELFVEDMDGQLRESGVGDLVVGKRIGALMGSLGGRLGALREMSVDDPAAMIAFIDRNVTMRAGADVGRIADFAKRLSEVLRKCSDEKLLAGEIFL